jgi:hypothetical protein
MVGSDEVYSKPVSEPQNFIRRISRKETTLGQEI